MDRSGELDRMKRRRIVNTVLLSFLVVLAVVAAALMLAARASEAKNRIGFFAPARHSRMGLDESSELQMDKDNSAPL